MKNRDKTVNNMKISRRKIPGFLNGSVSFEPKFRSAQPDRAFGENVIFIRWEDRCEVPSEVFRSCCRRVQTTQDAQVTRFCGGGDLLTPLELRGIPDRRMWELKKCNFCQYTIHVGTPTFFKRNHQTSAIADNFPSR